MSPINDNLTRIKACRNMNLCKKYDQQYYYYYGQEQDTNKNTEITSSLKSIKKNAIFMMCIINEHYVIAACITAFCHRRMLTKAGIKDTTDLVIMCDDKIYSKYHKLLENSLFFDVVEIIDVRKFEIKEDYFFSKIKYSSWIGASINKWQSLSHDEYHRIIFTDIALIPVRPELYELFNKNVPSVLIRKKIPSDKESYNCTDGEPIKNVRKCDISYDEYLKFEEIYGTIHGSIALLDPNKILYESYVKMTNDIYKNGIYSIYKSGPDETSLFYFFLKMNIKVYEICHENAVIPWDEPILVDSAKSYVFSSLFKAWIKPRVLCWPEELLWNDIFKVIQKLLVKSNVDSYTILNELYKQTHIDTYHKYVSSDSRTKQKNFNDKYVNRLRKEFDELSNIEDSDDLFDSLERLGSKIFVKFYGQLKTDTLTKIL